VVRSDEIANRSSAAEQVAERWSTGLQINALVVRLRHFARGGAELTNGLPSIGVRGGEGSAGASLPAAQISEWQDGLSAEVPGGGYKSIDPATLTALAGGQSSGCGGSGASPFGGGEEVPSAGTSSTMETGNPGASSIQCLPLPLPFPLGLPLLAFLGAEVCWMHFCG
jgi:hypothetical protein